MIFPLKHPFRMDFPASHVWLPEGNHYQVTFPKGHTLPDVASHPVSKCDVTTAASFFLQVAMAHITCRQGRESVVLHPAHPSLSL
jgi:hypothetical protein